MRVIPCSHVKAQLAYRRSTEAEHNVLSQTTLAAEEQGDPAVTIALRAGQVSLHTEPRRSRPLGRHPSPRGRTHSRPALHLTVEMHLPRVRSVARRQTRPARSPAAGRRGLKRQRGRPVVP